MEKSLELKKNFELGTRKVIRKDHSEAICGFLFASIPVVGFLLFGVVPLILSLIMAFSNVPTFDLGQMKLYDTENLFKNFATIFKDEKFYISIKNTALVCLSLPFSLGIGLILAVVLNQKGIKGSRIFRTIYFIPYVCSIVALSLIWRTMLNKNYGFVNQFLGIFGIQPVAWLTNPDVFMIGIIIMIVWCNVGFSLILYSAALTNVPNELYEAAEMDGAGTIRKFFKITIPLIGPTTFYLFMVGMIGCLQEFARIQALCSVNSQLISPTGPNDAGLTIVYYLYNKVFAAAGAGGQAAAASWVLTIATVFLTCINFSVNRKLQGKK